MEMPIDQSTDGEEKKASAEEQFHRARPQPRSSLSSNYVLCRTNKISNGGKVATNGYSKVQTRKKRDLRFQTEFVRLDFYRKMNTTFY